MHAHNELHPSTIKPKQSLKGFFITINFADQCSESLMNSYSAKVVGYAGHRARDPPDPIPNSEVKPRSVSGVSVVFGHAKPGKLAAPLSDYTLVEQKYSKFITD